MVARLAALVSGAVLWARQHAVLAALAVGAGVRLRATTGRGRALLVLFAVVLVGLPTAAGFAIAAIVSSAEGGTPRPPVRVAKIGLVVPLSGDLADVGGAVRNAVHIAVEEANQAGAVPGWTLELAAQDDLSRPDGGATAAENLTADPAVVGVVGPLSSTVAMVAMPTLADAGIAVVSPSNGRADLTGHGDDPRVRPYRTYFRLSGTDDLQARAAADYLVNTLGRPRVSVVDGGPDYGENLAHLFAGFILRYGGDVVSFRSLDGGDDEVSQDEVSQVATDLRADAPDAVYVATGPELAGDLRDRLALELPSVPIAGPDALLSARYLDGVETGADGDLVTDLGAPLSELPGAGAFVAAYAQRWFEPLPDQPESAGQSEASSGGTAEPGSSSSSGEQPGGEFPDGTPIAARTGQPSPRLSAGVGEGAGIASQDAVPAVPSPAESLSVAEHWASETVPSVAAYAYDAARALIRAAGVVLPGRPAVDAAARGGIVAAVARGSFTGVTGSIAFDQWGDPADPVATVYTVLGDRFVPLKLVRE